MFLNNQMDSGKFRLDEKQYYVYEDEMIRLTKSDLEIKKEEKV